MKFNINTVLICLTALIVSAAFYFSAASFNATLLQAAHIAGDKMSPRLQPTEHTVTVEGGIRIGNRKGSTLDMGVTMGKSNN